MTGISRRSALALAVGGAAVLGAAAGGAAAVLHRRSPPAAVPNATVTLDSWRAARSVPYYIGHRGVGTIAPEHTIPSYEAALAYGAQCLELSVVMSSDEVLFCQHDLGMERTTTLTGAAASHTAAELDQALVSVPRLGPRWTGPRTPRLARLSAALDTIGDRAVLCVEAKNDAAFPFVLAMLEERRLAGSAIIKLDGTGGRLGAAKRTGYPVFAYLGNPEVATGAAIRRLVAQLDPAGDVLVLPARVDLNTLFSTELIAIAVEAGISVWMFPVHRRYEADYFAGAGVEGMVTPSIGYLAGTVPVLTTDDWSSGGLPPGQLTRDPYSDAYSVEWGKEPGEVVLGFGTSQSFMLLGQFCPITAPSYRIDFDACFDPMPDDSWQHVSIAFGHADDRYYEHRLGDSDGYHALLRASGIMGLHAHTAGDAEGQELTASKQTAPLRAGTWFQVSLDVTSSQIRWSRDDGTSIEVTDSRFRGGYVHIGCSSSSGRLRLRRLTVR